MVERILETAAGRADAAEVFHLDTVSRDVLFEAGMLKSCERKTKTGAALRIIVDGRMGFAASSDPGRAEEMVDRAVESAHLGKKIRFTFPGSADVPRLNTFDAAVESFETTAAVEEGRRTVELLRERCPEVLTYTHLSTSVTEARIVNTAGLDCSYRYTGFHQGVTATLVKGDSILWVSDGGDYGALTLKTDRYVEHVSDLVRKAGVTAPKIRGKLPVIFTAREIPTLLASLEMGVDGLRMLKGDSPLIGREGERVLGNVTITDDPLLPDAPGSRPFDDEGVPSRRTALFRDGVFESFLFDLDTAADAGRESTASASRSLMSVPGIDTSNLVMGNGDSSLAEMIAGLDEGIIVYDILGGGQSNLLAGDFAVNVMLGFMVKDGEIAGRLTDTMLSGNVYEAFGGIDAIGSEILTVGSCFVPDVRFSALSVTGG